MKLLACLTVLLLLAGCGSGEQKGGENGAADSSGSTPMVGKCAADAPEVQVARTLATVDLDGDGTAETVKVTGSGGECPNTVFAKVGSRSFAAPTDDGPPVTNAFGVAIPGRTGRLLVTRSDHPRGGYQLRVYAAGPAELDELQIGGNPLVPFLATDVQEHPFSIDCGDGGLIVTEAVAHEPPGVAAAWDIRRTTYVFEGVRVTPGTTAEVADNVLPSQLGQKYPDLVRHTAFASCRA
jgi:hypothetical protein